VIFFTSLVKIVPTLVWFGFQGPLKSTQEKPLCFHHFVVEVVVVASPPNPPASSIHYGNKQSKLLANQLQLEMGILLLLLPCASGLSCLSLSLSPTSLFDQTTFCMYNISVSSSSSAALI
jgi:hypothetical protein